MDSVLNDATLVGARPGGIEGITSRRLGDEKYDKRHISKTAADGYAATAETYVRGRPDYPPEIADWLCNELNLYSESTVVDLGAGTGKFTPRLVATGAKVIAVEPVAEMLVNCLPRYLTWKRLLEQRIQYLTFSCVALSDR